jgi:cell division septum initiation protein DivIVA
MQDKTDWFAGDVDADGNPLTTLRTDELDKYKDQVRYTCQRAEKAEAALAAAQAEVARLTAEVERVTEILRQRDMAHTQIKPRAALVTP